MPDLRQAGEPGELPVLFPALPGYRPQPLALGQLPRPGDAVAVREPAVEVDILAARGTERVVRLARRLAADRAFAGGLQPDDLGHHTAVRVDWLSQLKWTG